MSNLHIRDMDESLLRQAKSQAALDGITLREYVIGLIQADLDRRKEDKSTRAKPRKQ